MGILGRRLAGEQTPFCRSPAKQSSPGIPFGQRDHTEVTRGHTLRCRNLYRWSYSNWHDAGLQGVDSGPPIRSASGVRLGEPFGPAREARRVGSDLARAARAFFGLGLARCVCSGGPRSRGISAATGARRWSAPIQAQPCRMRSAFFTRVTWPWRSLSHQHHDVPICLARKYASSPHFREPERGVGVPEADKWYASGLPEELNEQARLLEE